MNVLIDFYKTANKKDKDNLEVLYISMDQKESEYLVHLVDLYGRIALRLSTSPF